MTKKDPYWKQKCVHCHAQLDKATKDHIFPSSWYPAATKQDLEKWTVPSCEICNGRYSKIEETILTRISLCLDPNAIASSGLYARVRRSISPEFATNEREARIRLRKRASIGVRVVSREEIGRIPVTARMPGFEQAPIDDSSTQMTVQIPKEIIDDYLLKLGKCLALKFEGVYIDYPESHVIFRDGGENKYLMNLLNEQSSNFDWGEGVVLRRRTFSEDTDASLNYVELWKRWRFFIFIARK